MSKLTWPMVCPISPWSACRKPRSRKARTGCLDAIVNSGLNYPPRRITQNLAPADLPKDGGRYDLAIALGILAADGQVPTAPLTELECLGELALSGKLRPVQGVLPAALAARDAGRALVVPRKMPRKPAWLAVWWCMRWGICWNWSPT